MPGVLFVLSCSAKAQCWEEKAKPRQKLSSTHYSTLWLVLLQQFAEKKKARSASDGGWTSRLDWKVRHPLTINQFVVSLQALSFYSKYSTWCKPGVQMALPRCTQYAALPIWQAAVSLSFCQAANSGLFLLFFPLLSSLCALPYPLQRKLEEQMYNLGNFPHPSFK